MLENGIGIMDDLIMLRGRIKAETDEKAALAQSAHAGSGDTPLLDDIPLETGEE